MKPLYILSKSTNKNKKLMIKTPNKLIHFGSIGFSDFTIHKDPERRQRYILRHQKNENWNNLDTAGFWAKEILWGISPDINKCIKYIEHKFNIKIKNNL